MISVIIPTWNAQDTLVFCLSALVPGMVDGLIKEVIIVDGGSTDDTAEIARLAGVRLVKTQRGRGYQLARGAGQAKADWLLFLHADTLLHPGWETAARDLMNRPDQQTHQMAGAFRFRLDDEGFAPRLLELLVALRCALFRLPYGDQGLLISKTHYEETKGYPDVPLMEDVDLVRRIGRRNLTMLAATAQTSARRYRETGYWRRSARNLMCLAGYYLNIPRDRLARFYEGPTSASDQPATDRSAQTD